MSAAATLCNPATIGRAWYKCPLGTDDEPGQDEWPSAARKSFKFIAWRLRNGDMTLDDPDRVIADWLGVKRRVVQKGLRQLEDMGEISRHRQHGRRVITLLMPFKGPPAKPKRAPRKPATAAGNPAVPFATASAEAPDPEPTAEEQRKAADQLKEMLAARHKEQAAASAGRRSGPALARAVDPTPEQERERYATELDRLEAIPASERSALQEKMRENYAAKLGRPARE